MTSAPIPPRKELSPRARLVLGLLFFALGGASLWLYGGRAEREQVELQGAAMGTTWSVKLADPGLDAAAQRAAADAIAERLERVDRLMSTWKPDSELSRFNAHEGTDSFALSPETYAVLEIAQRVAEESGGAFDVTVGPLVDAWGFGSEGRREPPAGPVLRALRERTGWRKLALGPLGRTVRKSRPDVRVDLSAVAKGYAVDLVARGLESAGRERFLLEVGGELRASGERPGGGAWRVAIEAPDAPADARRVHRVVELRDVSMATSGDYRNYYERDGRRLSHTIDPRTGHPIEHRLASVSVIHPEAAWADAWATALDVLGPEEGYSLAASKGLPAYFLVRDAALPSMDGAPSGGTGASGEASFTVRMTREFEPYLAQDAPAPAPAGIGSRP
ncbi:MAG: FAD:protein FMN transferase [Myxococcales bacterium]|nr:FAD:protein FMN transferase [Myxococcales bacterium]